MNEERKEMRVVNHIEERELDKKGHKKFPWVFCINLKFGN